MQHKLRLEGHYRDSKQVISFEQHNYNFGDSSMGFVITKISQLSIDLNVKSAGMISMDEA